MTVTIIPTLRQARRVFEQQYMAATVEAAGGNLAAAARHYRQPIGSPPPRASDAEILATAARWEKRNPEFAAELRRRVLLGI